MTTGTASPPGPSVAEDVLSTLNRDGSRRWLRPRLSAGRFLNARRVVGYALIVLFSVLPFISIGGKPAILLDLPRREFTLFGTTFLPTDTLLFASLILSIFLTIFLVTALFGRVWCGWGCPQTVYMELVYRPIERLFEGKGYRSGRAGARSGFGPVKYVAYLVVSLALAHIFLAYFVGVDELFRWMRQSPFEHPTAFLIVAATTGLMMLDFCYMREQVCTLMCPYGRLQSVLLDRQSLIVSYDEKRGEPRGKLRRRAAASDTPRGDCVACNLCVTTCPTGIDIRKGLQMECIGCAQCIDACDAVMDKVGRQRGLIRYSSQQAMQEGKSGLLRPRVVIYPVLLAAALALFGVTWARKDVADVSFLRNRANPYRVLESGEVSSIVLVKIANRTDVPRSFEVAIPQGAHLESADLPLVVPGGESATATVHVALPRDAFARGRAEITVHVTDGQGFDRELEHHVLGPLFGGDSGGGS